MPIPTVCIDPGHGGDDPGVNHWPGFVEAEFNLRVGLRLRQLLCGSGWPVRVAMTRDTDASHSLRARNVIAKERGADLVLSIHANSVADTSRAGALFFHWPDNVLSADVADAIDAAFPSFLCRSSAVIETHRDNGYPNARNVVGAYSAPCVLVETGFASNDDDRAYLLSDAGQNSITAALAVGVACYLGISR